MKKISLIILVLFLVQNISFANFNDIYIADIQYDWIDKSEIEKETIISEVRDIIFENGELTKQEDFRAQFKDRLKDKSHREHYLAASAGYKEYKDHNITAFYYKISYNKSFWRRGHALAQFIQFKSRWRIENRHIF